MIYRKLGRTDIEISVLGMGCFPLSAANGCSHDMAAGVLETAFAAGVNYYDCAPSYGNGDAEEYLGRFLWKHRDDPIYFNDKVGRYAQWNPVNQPGTVVTDPDSNYRDPDVLLLAIKRSLWVLRRDYFDVLTIHEPNWPVWGFDYDTGDCVALSLLEELKNQGLCRYIGLGGWDNHLNAKLVDTGRIDVVMAAGGMNLMTAPIFEELMPAAHRHGTGIVLGGALGQGNSLMLSLDRGRLQKLYSRGDEKSEITARQLDGLYKICEQTSMTMAELAIRYILSFEMIHSHVVGTKFANHMKANIQAIEKGVLPKDITREIERLQRLGDGLTTRQVSKLIMTDI